MLGYAWIRGLNVLGATEVFAGLRDQDDAHI